MVHANKSRLATTQRLLRGLHFSKMKPELEIKIPTIEKQKFILKSMDKAYSIRKKREESLKLTDDFIHSLYLHMFEDSE